MYLKQAFDLWWVALTRKGDPLRRPRLTEEAFEAGWKAALELVDIDLAY